MRSKSTDPGTLRSVSDDDDLSAPLFGLRGLVLAGLLSLLACWPMFAADAVYVFADTASYIRAGGEIWRIVLSQLSNILPAADNGAAATSAGGAAMSAAAEGLVFDKEPRFGRSIAYSAFVYPIVSVAGPLGLVWAQGTLTFFALFALVTPQILQARGTLLAGTVMLLVATQLPWRVVYLMPDIFGAIILVFGMALAGPFDGLSRGQKITLTCLAIFAVSTHYGYIPVAVGFLGLVMLWRIATSRFAMAATLAALVTVAVPPLTNLGASHAVLDNASAVPLRLPIVLARSIQDGPGAEYLRDNCGTEDWAICEAFGGRVPESIRAFLWSDDGIRSQSPEMVQRIRDEELALLSQIFLTHPVAQSWSLARNSVLQMIRVGQGQISTKPDFERYLTGDRTRSREADALVASMEPVVVWGTLVSGVLLASLAVFGPCTADERRLVVFLLLGLVCNAIVFGGLSAPVDRYQARVAWLIPALLALLAAAVVARSRDTRRFEKNETNVL